VKEKRVKKKDIVGNEIDDGEMTAANETGPRGPPAIDHSPQLFFITSTRVLLALILE